MDILEEMITNNPVLFEIAKFAMTVKQERERELSHFSDILSKFDVSSYDVKFLTLIAGSKKRLMVSDLADIIGITNSTVSIRLNGLEEKQLIERESSVEDKRKKFIKITDLGREIVEWNTPNPMDKFMVIINSLSDEEKMNLMNIVKKLSQKYMEVNNLPETEFDMRKQLQILMGFE